MCVCADRAKVGKDTEDALGLLVSIGRLRRVSRSGSRLRCRSLWKSNRLLRLNGVQENHGAEDNRKETKDLCHIYFSVQSKELM
jgi:hypothetical protein